MMWCSLRGWPKAETRGVLQPFNVVILSLAVLGYLLSGFLDRGFLIKLAVCLPLTLLAAQAGIALFNWMSDVGYRRLLVWMMVLSGLSLLWREWWH